MKPFESDKLERLLREARVAAWFVVNDFARERLPPQERRVAFEQRGNYQVEKHHHAEHDEEREEEIGKPRAAGAVARGA